MTRIRVLWQRVTGRLTGSRYGDSSEEVVRQVNKGLSGPDEVRSKFPR